MIFDRDLTAAGIAKRDERWRTVDVHVLRHSFGTHLSKGGVTLRTAQAAMRHSTPTLTANIYTDPKLLDVAGALDALPDLPLDGASLVAPNVALAGYNSSDFESIPDTSTGRNASERVNTRTLKNANVCKGNRTLSRAGKEKKMVGGTGLEPVTPCMSSRFAREHGGTQRIAQTQRIG
ncbi:MAG: tyrosine-type recombinase/integrase [Candidatus Hydrogenedentes bacterium]|nr:tyrosine-type recombinase/integrase [Candidatus Hydrogenedentota bacterium]